MTRAIGPLRVLRDNIASSTKLVNVTVRVKIRVTGGPSHDYRQHAQQKLVKFGHVVFEICERTDTQLDKQTDTNKYLAPFPEVK